MDRRLRSARLRHHPLAIKLRRRRRTGASSQLHTIKTTKRICGLGSACAAARWKVCDEEAAPEGGHKDHKIQDEAMELFLEDYWTAIRTEIEMGILTR